MFAQSACKFDFFVIPAETGIQISGVNAVRLDSGFRRNDGDRADASKFNNFGNLGALRLLCGFGNLFEGVFGIFWHNFLFENTAYFLKVAHLFCKPLQSAIYMPIKQQSSKMQFLFFSSYKTRHFKILMRRP